MLVTRGQRHSKNLHRSVQFDVHRVAAINALGRLAHQMCCQLDSDVPLAGRTTIGTPRKYPRTLAALSRTALAAVPTVQPIDGLESKSAEEARK